MYVHVVGLTTVLVLCNVLVFICAVSVVVEILSTFSKLCLLGIQL